MPYTYTLPSSVSFTGKGLLGYAFGPLSQKDLDIYYIEVDKGHDTFMISKKITRTYYVLSGNGYFTIDHRRYDVSPGMLVEVPAKVEYCYSGRMTLIAFARPRWFRENDTHTKWNPDVAPDGVLPPTVRGTWWMRAAKMTVFGKSPLRAYLRLNQQVWRRVPAPVTRLAPVRVYGAFLNALARVQGDRAQALSTFFLRNRPELELMSRLVNSRIGDEPVRVAVLGCSVGAQPYSVAWALRSGRPGVKLMLTAADVCAPAVQLAEKGIYSLKSSEITNTTIFERVTPAEMNEIFHMDGRVAIVKDWIRQGIQWRIADAHAPDLLEVVGRQDLVVANNFLCHMHPLEAESCLRNIARLVKPGGHLFVSGIDLDVKTKVARDLGWRPVTEMLEQIHEGDPCLRSHWPSHYAGLEPLNKKRKNWETRYAAAFELPSARRSLPSEPASEFVAATS